MNMSYVTYRTNIKRYIRHKIIYKKNECDRPEHLVRRFVCLIILIKNCVNLKKNFSKHYIIII